MLNDKYESICINDVLISVIVFRLNPTEQGSSHPQYPKHPREETTTMVTG